MQWYFMSFLVLLWMKPCNMLFKQDEIVQKTKVIMLSDSFIQWGTQDCMSKKESVSCLLTLLSIPIPPHHFFHFLHRLGFICLLHILAFPSKFSRNFLLTPSNASSYYTSHQRSNLNLPAKFQLNFPSKFTWNFRLQFLWKFPSYWLTYWTSCWSSLETSFSISHQASIQTWHLFPQ